MDKLSAYVIFCDDLRQEVGDKKTFVGVYNEELYIPCLPTLIPKFYVVTAVSCYVEKIPAQLTVRLTLGDDELDKTTVSSEELEKWRVSLQEEHPPRAAEDSPDQPPMARLILEMLISPFWIRDEGRLASYVDTERGTLCAGSIGIIRRDGAPTVALKIGPPKSEKRLAEGKAP